MCWKCKRRLAIRRSGQYEILSETKPKNLPKPSDDKVPVTEEPPEFASSQANQVNIPLRKINSNEQRRNMYGTVAGSTTHTNYDALGPQLKLQVDDEQN